jgi:hypothetical protein
MKIGDSEVVGLMSEVGWRSGNLLERGCGRSANGGRGVQSANGV